MDLWIFMRRLLTIQLVVWIVNRGEKLFKIITGQKSQKLKASNMHNLNSSTAGNANGQKFNYVVVNNLVSEKCGQCKLDT